jgi:hypothetical protein
MNMKRNEPPIFPLANRPSHYLACVENPGPFGCTHVSIKLVPSTLIRLGWMHWVGTLLHMVGIKIAVFESKADALDLVCLEHKDRYSLEAEDETSNDDAPYDCLSLGELASLGGYATHAVLEAYFAPIPKDARVYALDVHVEKYSMWLKIYFFGPVPSVETNAFNLGILVKDFLVRSVRWTAPEHKTVDVLE